MMRLVFAISLLLSFDAMATTSSGKLLSYGAQGSSAVTASNADTCTISPGPNVDPEPNCNDKDPTLSGFIWIHGESAELMFKLMKDVPIHPADPDLETKELSEVSRGMLESRAGHDYSCVNMPKVNSRREVERDENGRWKFERECVINVRSFNSGTLK